MAAEVGWRRLEHKELALTPIPWERMDKLQTLAPSGFPL